MKEIEKNSGFINFKGNGSFTALTSQTRPSVNSQFKMKKIISWDQLVILLEKVFLCQKIVANKSIPLFNSLHVFPMCPLDQLLALVHYKKKRL